MTLSELLKKHNHCNDQLVAAIADSASELRIRALDGELVAVVNSIEDLDLHDAADIEQQLKFFLLESRGNDSGQVLNSGLRSIEVLIERYANRLGSN